MKEKENKELLTPNLYIEISTDKCKKIASLKGERTEKLKSIKLALEDLKNLRNEIKRLRRKVRITKRLIYGLRKEKFKLNIELDTQKRLSDNLNKKMMEENAYISVSRFYPEIKTK